MPTGVLCVQRYHDDEDKNNDDDDDDTDADSKDYSDYGDDIDDARWNEMCAVCTTVHIMPVVNLAFVVNQVR